MTVLFSHAVNEVIEFLRREPAVSIFGGEINRPRTQRDMSRRRHATTYGKTGNRARGGRSEEREEVKDVAPHRATAHNRLLWQTDINGRDSFVFGHAFTRSIWTILEDSNGADAGYPERGARGNIESCQIIALSTH